MRSFDIVVATDQRRGIGVGGALPWRLPADLKHFRSLTQSTVIRGRKNAVLMGRKTWDSIPERFRPLSGRLNIVLSRNVHWEPPQSVHVCSDLPAALETVWTGSPAPNLENVFVIGGGSIYQQALRLPMCQRIYLTRILHEFSCDTFFPRYDDNFECTAILQEGRENELDYTIELWHRKKSDG